ncbi:DUF2293 domain-containing protein [Persicimonas caeni]|uniref:DUF2293 domain-containing protein n=1 Tax=Persicimonas caeni TaxID=2292766 RepID=A0A4Y6PMA1_PERCE|nr:DUF2293 domain-containing protein [Persicimonas caeni]QDG49428.1 DUF2293 domain-containing protein [Persicimonas caeni]QED30649.1 DUF2293 domain-containing protein [Persicimonas caeni]
MSDKSRIVSPFPRHGYVRNEEGRRTKVPEGWALLEPGDATITRRVKEAGPSWTVQEKKGRRTYSKGVWAPAETIERVKREVEQMRSTPEYRRRREADKKRREEEQRAYKRRFRQAVLDFLAFDDEYAELAQQLADAVTEHAVPVGSGTVARTKRIPLPRRAEAAVIAWMRHQTTAYDTMTIARVKGRRREVRRKLAERSRKLLERYRRGEPLDADDCPLQKALDA